MKRKLFLFLLLLCPLLRGFGQGEIPVNMYTGTPTIEVPLWTASFHDIKVPFSLQYDASGVRLKQQDGMYGVGWQLAGAGSIKRTVKGLPDEFNGAELTGSSNPYKGWLHTNAAGTRVAADVASLSNTADLSAATCDEQADNSKIHGWNYDVDTEPDVFTFSFAGYSGSFVFDNSSAPIIRFIPYKDFTVTYTTEINKGITTFTIKTLDGYKYTFAGVVGALRYLNKDPYLNSVTFLQQMFKQFASDKSGGYMSYTIEWKLTRIDSPTGAYVDFEYNSGGTQSKSSQSATVGIYFNDLAGYKTIHAFDMEEGTFPRHLKLAKGSSGEEIEFYRSGESLDKIVIRDRQRGTGNEVVKEYLFNYEHVWGYKFLKEITELSACDRVPPYGFEYIGMSNVQGLPNERTTSSKDFWGYFNGKNNPNLIPKMYIYPEEPLTERFRLHPIPGYTGTEIVLDGSDRLPDADFMKLGTLNKITYPSGGGAIIQYESHTYFDARTNQSYIGGGLRVKSISQYDGVSTQGAITKEFNYNNPASGQSSGKLISRPTFIMPAFKYRDPADINNAAKELTFEALSGKTLTEQWKYLTLRTGFDLSEQANTQGSAVGYQFVTVKRAGAGSALFEYFVPGTYGEANANTWSPTENKIVRPSNCPAIGLNHAGGPWSVYPYATNMNFEAERGLLWKKTEYNEAGKTLRYIENEYQYIYKTGTAPHKVWGVQYDRYPNSNDNIYMYGKYSLLADYDKVLSKETVTTYDVADRTKSLTISSQLFYSSPVHKFLTSIQKTSADNTVYTTDYKYALDYGSIPANAEPALLRIKDLQSPIHPLHSVAVEQVSRIQRPGDVQRVTGASLTKFSDFSRTGKVLPQQHLVLSVAAPVTDFVPTAPVLKNGTYYLNVDSRYDTVQTVLAYDDYDIAISATGMNRIPVSTTLGYNKTRTVASATHASKGEYAFSDFETSTADEFGVTNAYYATPRTGKKGLHPYGTLSKTVIKAGNNYMLSFWLKNTGAVSFKVAIKSTNLATTYYENTFSITPTSGDFELVRRIVPVTSAPASFVVQISGQSLAQPTASSSTLTPAMDDVAFLPEGADLVSTAYDYNPTYDIVGTTNAQGVTTYKEYDKMMRNKFVYDHDKNIVLKNSQTYHRPLIKLSADFTVPSVAYKDKTINFSVLGNPCVSGIKYEWDLGTGSYVVGGEVATRAFAVAGVYTIKVRVSHPVLGEVTSRKSITIVPEPIDVYICMNGFTQYNCGIGSSPQVGCPDKPVPSSGTYFYALASNASSATLKYQWQIYDMELRQWRNVGTDTERYALTRVDPRLAYLSIRCLLTISDGRAGGENNTETLNMDCAQ